MSYLADHVKLFSLEVFLLRQCAAIHLTTLSELWGPPLYHLIKVVPLNALSMDDVSSKISGMLSDIESKPEGVVKEVAKVYQQYNGGGGIPVKFIRNGTEQTKIFKFNNS